MVETALSREKKNEEISDGDKDSVLMLSGPAHSANGTMLCAEVAHKLFHMAHWKTDANIQSKLTKLTEAQRTFSLCWNLKNVRSAISDPTASVQEAC